MSFRIRASCLHFLLSACVAILTGFVVFWVWYPSPYAILSGGMSLFVMLIGIDVVLGPALTALVANPNKKRKELWLDIGLIVIVQLLAFSYGIYTISSARPVHLVFEVDRFRVVTAADIETDQLDKAPAAYRRLPWTGPTLIAARKSATQDEFLRSLDLGLQGVDISMLPEHWIDYSTSVEMVLNKARPAKLLMEKYPHMASKVQALISIHHVTPENAYFLPLVSRKANWVVLVTAPNAEIVGYLEADGFF